MTQEQITSFVISADVPISQAVTSLDAAGIGALVICSSGNKLRGILTDGDIRRAVMRADSFDAPCGVIATGNPIVAPQSTTRLQALHLMNRHDIDHLPIVDEHGVLQDLLLRRDLIGHGEIDLDASELLDSMTLHPFTSIAAAITQLDKAGTGALVLCSEDRMLVGLLTDGDIRRAILRGVSLEAQCKSISSLEPLTVTGSKSTAEALEFMIKHDINHLPVVDSAGCVIRILLRRNLLTRGQTDLSAVIMAGGYGTRLLPLTEQTPKPMLPIGDRPLLELTIQQLRRSGIRDISLTTHYLPESITQYFGDGKAFGVRLNYLKENQPLGTAGGIKMMRRTENPFVVINGDIITGVPFQEMLNFHREHDAWLTVGVRKYDVDVPFGVVDMDEVRVNQIREKPSFTFFINAGIYLLEPKVCDFIPSEQRFDMTELIQKLIEAGRVVVSFPIMEYWLDIGRHEDYVKAQEDVRNGVL